MKFLERIIFFTVTLVLLNSLLIVYLYRNFWFIVVSLSFGLSVIIFVNLIRQKVILDIPEKLSRLKFFTSLILIISIFNFSFSILGYTLNFVKNNYSRNSSDNKKGVDYNFLTTQIKGKVFSLINRNVCIPNAKITLIHKDTNIIVDVFYTNYNGEFEYKLSSFLKEGGNFKLIIEHPDYEKYTTEFKIFAFHTKEIEIFMQPKKLVLR